VTWVNCVRDIVVNVIKSAAAGFKDCWNNVRKAVGGAYMDLIKNCHSVDACLKHLLKGPKALWDKIVSLAKAGVNKLLYSGPLGKGVQWISNVIKKIPPTIREIGSIGKDVGMAISKFVQGAIHAIRNLGNINMCSTSGYGFWYLWPTDCGAFGRMKEIFKFHNLHKIPSIFGDVVKRFGKCVIKLGMLSLPSPFLDVKIKSWCVPKVLQPVIKGIVGTFRFVIAQIAAGVAGCAGSHKNQPVCIMVEDMKKIGDKLKNMFSSQFLQKTTEVIGESMTGDKDQFAVSSGVEAKCLTNTDFQFTVALVGSIAFPPWGDSLSIGLTGAIGCRKKVLFGDFIIALGGSLFIAGFDIKLPDARKTKFCPPGVTLAFAIGTPGTDIVTWSGSFSLAGAVTVGGLEAKIGLGFKVLPIPTYPTGFSVSPKIDVKCPFLLQGAEISNEQRAACEEQKAMLFEQEARERELDDEVAKHEKTEDKIYTAVGVLIKQYSELPHEKYVSSGALMSALQQGASFLSGGEDSEGSLSKRSDSEASKFPLPKEVSLTAGLGINFCCTCGISGSGSNAPRKIASDPWPRRRRDRRRRDRRRRDRRRRDRRRSNGGLSNGRTVGLLGGRHRRWCADEINRIRCNRGWIHGWERFYVWNHGGRIALRGGRGHRWCADDHHGVRCNRGHIYGWEKFWLWTGGGRVAFKGGRGHRWCADEGHRWICNRGHIYGWEKFQVQVVRRRRR